LGAQLPARHLRIDTLLGSLDNAIMNIAEISAIPTEVMAELRQAAERAAQGIRDPEEMSRACEEMDRVREEIRRKHGTLDIGVPAIRELRDAE
jgi:hypothetical protein